MTQDDPRRPAARSALSRAARPLLRHPPRARRRRREVSTNVVYGAAHRVSLLFAAHWNPCQTLSALLSMSVTGNL